MGKMRMKKNCWYCRALYEMWKSVTGGGNIVDYECNLGYKIEERVTPNKLNLKATHPAPTEICPKPRTWREYDDADVVVRNNVQRD